MPATNAGSKNGKPWMWSQCTWLKKMCAVSGISFSSFLPSRRRPVPPSKMRRALPARTSTQLVLPPISTVSGPGRGDAAADSPERDPHPRPSLLSGTRRYDDLERTSARQRKVFLVPVVANRSQPHRAPSDLEAVVASWCSDALELAVDPCGARLRRASQCGAGRIARGRTGAARGVARGRAWQVRRAALGRCVEADVMADELARRGVPRARDRSRALVAEDSRRTRDSRSAVLGRADSPCRGRDQRVARSARAAAPFRARGRARRGRIRSPPERRPRRVARVVSGDAARERGSWTWAHAQSADGRRWRARSCGAHRPERPRWRAVTRSRAECGGAGAPSRFAGACLVAAASGCRAHGGPRSGVAACDAAVAGAASPAAAPVSRSVAAGAVEAAAIAPPTTGPMPDVMRRIGAAEDERRASDVPSGASAERRRRGVRRAAARAFARILAADDDALLRALDDEDRDGRGWGAYGLGFACKGRRREHVRALAARLASLAGGADRAPATIAPRRRHASHRLARARSLRRRACRREPLARLVAPRGRRAMAAKPPRTRSDDDRVAAAGAVEDETAAVLLGARGRAAGPLDAALYPFERAGARARPRDRRAVSRGDAPRWRRAGRPASSPFARSSRAGDGGRARSRAIVATRRRSPPRARGSGPRRSRASATWATRRAAPRRRAATIRRARATPRSRATTYGVRARRALPDDRRCGWRQAGRAGSVRPRADRGPPVRPRRALARRLGLRCGAAGTLARGAWTPRSSALRRRRRRAGERARLAALVRGRSPAIAGRRGTSCREPSRARPRGRRSRPSPITPSWATRRAPRSRTRSPGRQAVRGRGGDPAHPDARRSSRRRASRRARPAPRSPADEPGTSSTALAAALVRRSPARGRRISSRRARRSSTPRWRWALPETARERRPRRATTSTRRCATRAAKALARRRGDGAAPSPTCARRADRVRPQPRTAESHTRWSPNRRRVDRSTPTPGSSRIRFDPTSRRSPPRASSRSRAPASTTGSWCIASCRVRRAVRRSGRRRLRRLGAPPALRDVARCPSSRSTSGVALAGRDTGSSQLFVDARALPPPRRPSTRASVTPRATGRASPRATSSGRTRRRFE